MKHNANISQIFFSQFYIYSNELITTISCETYFVFQPELFMIIWRGNRELRVLYCLHDFSKARSLKFILCPYKKKKEWMISDGSSYTSEMKDCQSCFTIKHQDIILLLFKIHTSLMYKIQVETEVVLSNFFQ